MQDKDAEARKLAEAHYVIEPGISRIFRIREQPDVEQLSNEPIKLLEVNADTIPAGIIPVYFAPAPGMGITYPSTIVEVTPEEFDRIQSRELLLPQGWMLADLLPKTAGSNGE